MKDRHLDETNQIAPFVTSIIYVFSSLYLYVLLYIFKYYGQK